MVTQGGFITCLRISGSYLIRFTCVCLFCLSDLTGQFSLGSVLGGCCLYVRLGRSAHDQLLTIYLSLYLFSSLLFMYICLSFLVYAIAGQEQVVKFHPSPQHPSRYKVSPSRSDWNGMDRQDRTNEGRRQWQMGSQPASQPANRATPPLSLPRFPGILPYYLLPALPSSPGENTK